MIAEQIEHDVEKRKCIAVLTPSEMLQVAGIAHPTNAQAKECAGILRDLFGASRRINGRDRWRVPLRPPTGKELHPHAKLKIEDIFG